MYKIYVYPEEFKEMMEMGLWNQYKGDNPLEESDFSEKDEWARQRLGSIGMDAGFEPSSNDNSKRYEITEYFDNGEFTWWLNEKRLLRYEKEPFYHGGHGITGFKFWPVANEIYGISLMDLVRDINTAIDFMYNQRCDQSILTMMRPFFMDVSKLENPTQDLIIEPLGINRVRSGMENLQSMIMPMPIPPPDSSTYKEVDILKNMAEMITGISDYMRGQMSPSLSDTATGINILTQRSLNQMLFHNQYIASVSVVANMRLIIGLNNLNLYKTVKYSEGNIQYKITPLDIIEDYDIVAKSDPSDSQKEMERAHFQQGLQMVGAVPQMAALQNWKELSERYWALYKTIKMPQKCIYTEEQLMEERQRQIVEQQQLQMFQQQVQAQGQLQLQQDPAIQALQQQGQQQQAQVQAQAQQIQQQQAQEAQMQQQAQAQQQQLQQQAQQAEIAQAQMMQAQMMGQAPPPQPPRPNIPLIESPMDLMRQFARTNIGNADKHYG